MTDQGYIYLACPYSHENAAVREWRYQTANRYAALLMEAGYVVFSPLSHSHPVAQFMGEEALMDHDLWMKQDLVFVRGAELVLVLEFPGWEKSRGVQRELDFAEEHGVRVCFTELTEDLRWIDMVAPARESAA